VGFKELQLAAAEGKIDHPFQVRGPLLILLARQLAAASLTSPACLGTGLSKVTTIPELTWTFDCLNIPHYGSERHERGE